MARKVEFEMLAEEWSILLSQLTSGALAHIEINNREILTLQKNFNLALQPVYIRVQKMRKDDKRQRSSKGSRMNGTESSQSSFFKKLLTRRGGYTNAVFVIISFYSLAEVKALEVEDNSHRSCKGLNNKYGSTFRLSYNISSASRP